MTPTFRASSGTTIVLVLSSIVIFSLYFTFTTLQNGKNRRVIVSPPSGDQSGFSQLNDIYNATLGFERVFVVGLPERTDRRDSMTLAAALSRINIEFIDGVKPEDIVDKALPVGNKLKQYKAGNLGSWRAHLNAIQRAVQMNLSSALILEDDVDWDIRIRDQLQGFARSTKALTQPLSKMLKTTYADPTYISRSDEAPVELDFIDLPDTILPENSPYGDDWDFLWLGHCGMGFPKPTDHMPKGRVLRFSDPTVAEKHHLTTWNIGTPFDALEPYPSHTRVVNHISGGVCTVGMAVSQKGARNILYWAGVKGIDQPYDVWLCSFCEMHRCLGVIPPLFAHHRPAGPKSHQSDINDYGSDYNDKPYTDNIRLATKVNFEELLQGGTNFSDQYPDTVAQ